MTTLLYTIKPCLCILHVIFVKRKSSLTIRSEDIPIMRIGLGLDTDSDHYVLKIYYYLQTLCGFFFSEHLFPHHYAVLTTV